MLFSSGFSHLLTLLLLNVCVQAVDVTVPLRTPGAATNIAPDHVSLSIEQDRWIEWVGSTSRNDFFFNSLDNLIRLTGVPPRIRIGGQTADVANPSTTSPYYASYVDSSSSDVPYPAAYGMSLGPNFYPSVRFLPPNTKVVAGVNYGANDDLRAALHISSITKAFALPEVVQQGITLEAIELGHEPDRYGKDNYFRSWDPSWSSTSAKYISEWTNWVKNIKDITLSGWQGPAVDLPFWTGSVSTLAPRTGSWTGKFLVNNGLVPDNIAGNIKTFSQHHYSGLACKGAAKDLKTLLSKSSIRGGLNAFRDDIAAVKAKGLEYVLGEASSSSCHGTAGVSNVAGSAIWALDYLLYASQIGISRVYLHNGLGYRFNLLQPGPLTRSPLDNSPLSPASQPYIGPSYYAAVIAAELIGNSGQTRVAELSIPNDGVSGYAFYDGNTLRKAVFINLNVYLKTDKTRSSVRVNVAFDGKSPSTAIVKRLTVPYSDGTSGLSWSGITYETSSARPNGDSKSEIFSSANGIDVQASEVVVLTFSS